MHLYIGQEAVAVGAAAALRPEDYLLTTYRDHGMALARGMSPRAAMAEQHRGQRELGQITLFCQGIR